MNTQSLPVRLTFWYTTLIIVAAIAFGSYTYFSLEHRLYEEIQTMLARRLVHLREDVWPEVGNVPSDVLAKKIEDIYSPGANDRFIRISKADGTILYVSGKPRDQGFDPAAIPLVSQYGNEPTEKRGDLRKSQNLLLVGLKATRDGRDYIMEMGTTVTPAQATLNKLIITLLFGLPVIVLVAASGGYILVRHALHPVEEMRATAEKISFGKLRQRLPLTKSGDAIDHLAVTLNQMLDRLDQAYQQATRFSADASHELRTPLTVLRTEMEAELHKPGLTPAYRDRIGSYLEDTERLSVIVENLFSLARLDAGEAKVEHKVFDLSTLAHSTLDQMRLLADEKKLIVTVDAPQSVPVMGDAARMRQVIVNLTGNAIKYTPDGGKIAIAVRAAGGEALLTVTDNGIGIPAYALPHIFERFYRVDRVRSSAAQGAGLGLSIADVICQAHGGTLSAESVEGAGTAMTVSLPLASSQS